MHTRFCSSLDASDGMHVHAPRVFTRVVIRSRALLIFFRALLLALTNAQCYGNVILKLFLNSFKYFL